MKSKDQLERQAASSSSAAVEENIQMQVKGLKDKLHKSKSNSYLTQKYKDDRQVNKKGAYGKTTQIVLSMTNVCARAIKFLDISCEEPSLL